MSSGGRNKRMVRSLFTAQCGRCAYCEQPMTFRDAANKATIDHVVPRAKGGASRRENYVAACRRCNGRKAARPLADFLGIAKAIGREITLGDVEPRGAWMRAAVAAAALAERNSPPEVNPEG